jgi:hypothetical protein
MWVVSGVPPWALSDTQAVPYTWTLLYCPMHFLTHELLLFATGVWTTNIHDCLHGKVSAPERPVGCRPMHGLADDAWLLALLDASVQRVRQRRWCHDVRIAHGCGWWPAGGVTECALRAGVAHHGRGLPHHPPHHLQAQLRPLLCLHGLPHGHSHHPVSVGCGLCPDLRGMGAMLRVGCEAQGLACCAAQGAVVRRVSSVAGVAHSRPWPSVLRHREQYEADKTARAARKAAAATAHVTLAANPAEAAAGKKAN